MDGGKTRTGERGEVMGGNRGGCGRKRRGDRAGRIEWREGRKRGRERALVWAVSECTAE